MNWEDTKRLLAELLCPYDCVDGDAPLDSSRLNRWLAHVESSTDPAGERLVVCLCIDLVSGHLAPADVAGVIAELPCEEAPPGLEFARTVESKHLHCRNKNKTRAQVKGEYVRILNLRGYSSYYHEPSTPGATGDEVELRLLKEKLDAAPENGLALENIDRSWQGGSPIVWVSRWQLIAEVRARFAEGAATVLNDRTGLGHQGDFADCTLYAIRYPPQFLNFCCQPTTFDADWRGKQFYVSFRKSDGWGRTHSCSGAPGHIPERVHSAIHANLRFFRCFPLGTAAPAAPDRGRLLKAAYKRLEEAKRRADDSRSAAIHQTGR